MLVRGCTERDDEMVVRQVVRDSLGGGSNDLAIHVDAFDRCLDEPCLSESSTDWLRTVPQFQPSGARLEQKRRDDKEILAADQRDLDALVSAQRALQVRRRCHTAESAAEY